MCLPLSYSFTFRMRFSFWWTMWDSSLRPDPLQAVDRLTKKDVTKDMDLHTVDDIGLDLHFLPMAENRGSHQCLHWRQEVSTGHFP